MFPFGTHLQLGELVGARFELPCTELCRFIVRYATHRTMLTTRTHFIHHNNRCIVCRYGFVIKVWTARRYVFEHLEKLQSRSVDIKTLPGTMQFHSFLPIENYKLAAKLFSKDENARIYLLLNLFVAVEFVLKK